MQACRKEGCVRNDSSVSLTCDFFMRSPCDFENENDASAIKLGFRTCSTRAEPGSLGRDALENRKGCTVYRSRKESAVATRLLPIQPRRLGITRKAPLVHPCASAALYTSLALSTLNAHSTPPRTSAESPSGFSPQTSSSNGRR